MNQILLAALVGLLVGAGGALAGTLVAFLLKTTGKKLSAALLGFAGGIMLATFFFDMLPHSLHDAGVWPVVLGIALGALLMLVVTKVVPHKDAAEIDSCDAAELKSGALVRTGMLLALGMAIHNLPQGIAIGSSVAAGIGTALAILLLIHNIPEGMAMALPLKIGGVPYRRILLISLVAALPTAIGAVIGALVAGISETFIGACIAFAGGAMVFLTLKELIPQSLRIHKSMLTVLFIVAGVALGRLIVWLTHTH